MALPRELVNGLAGEHPCNGVLGGVDTVVAAFSKECTRCVSFRDGEILDETSMEVSCNADKQGEKEELDEETTNNNLFSELHRVQGTHSHDSTAYTAISTGWMSSLSPKTYQSPAS